MLKKLFLVILLLGSIDAFAQHRSKQDAIQIALAFFKPTAKQAELTIVPMRSVQAEWARRSNIADGGHVDLSGFYVVNDEANSRFVIISADERMHKVLGYSDHGAFDVVSVADGLLFLLQEYNMQYHSIVGGQVQAVTADETEVTEIPHIIQSQWNQGYPYWNDCPNDAAGNKCYTGCVATAMAQIMNYYRWPENACGGIVSYEPSSNIAIGQSFDFNSLSINWDYMLNTYTADATQEQMDEVAKLMHACGVSAYMSYTHSTVSAADPKDVDYAMINYFGYNPNLHYAERKYYENNEWYQLIVNELKAGRPILYGGSGSGDHRFILDGMDANGKFHFNFGWSGKYDGHYDIDAITPSNRNYSSNQSMIIGLSPGVSGEHADVFYADEFKLDTIASVGGTSTIKSFLPHCFSNEANTSKGKARFKGEYGIGLFDKDFRFIKSMYKQTGTSSARGIITSIVIGDGPKITFDAATFTEGSQYYIAPYAKCYECDNPTLIRTEAGRDDWYRVTVKEGQVILNRKMMIDGDIPHTSNNVYAVWCEGNSTLYFLQNDENLSVGGTFDGQVITNVWEGYDILDSGNKPAWVDVIKQIVTRVVFDMSFQDVAPLSTRAWFYYNTKLAAIDGLNYLNTNHVIDMSYMFGKCSSLSNIDVSGFTTANVTNMYGMFAGCSIIKTLDLSEFDTQQVTDMTGMFYDCTELNTIYAGDKWNTERITACKDMFTNCKKIVGGNGTLYDANHTDASYARIDRTDAPGYLTDKAGMIVPEHVTLTLTCSEGGYLIYNGVTVTNDTKQFQVEKGDMVIVEYGPLEGYIIDVGPVIGIASGTKIGQNSHQCVIYNIKHDSSISISFKPSDSGIEDILLESSCKLGVWYTLQGVRLDGKPIERGIYLHQGWKVMVK